MTYTFNGENCRIFIEKKGGTAQEVTGRLYSGNLTNPARVINYEKTDARHMPSYEGYEPGNISLNFYFDDDDSIDRMTSYLGSQSIESSMKVVRLTNNRPSKYKVKFLFENYGATFGGTPETGIKIIYYNAQGVNIQKTLSTDNAANGILQFSFTPFNNLGSSNYIEIEKQIGDSVANFNAVESAYDTEMGY